MIVYSFPSLSETFILNQITYLIDKEYEVAIFSFRQGPMDKVHDKVLKYRLLERTVFFYKGSGHLLNDIQSFFENSFRRNGWNIFLKMFKSLKIFSLGLNSKNFYYAMQYLWLPDLDHFQVVHAHFGDVSIFPSRLKKTGLLGNSRLLVSFHGYDLIPNEAVYNQKRYKDLFDQADRFTVNSLFTKKELTKTLSESKWNKIQLLPESLDCSFFSKRPNSLPKSKVTIVFCGRLINWKAPDLAIDIFYKFLQQKDIEGKPELWIIGGGPMETELRLQVDRLGISDHVKLLGRRNQIEIIDLLSKADIFLYPGISDPKTGRAENQGLVIQEAQAMQLPVVVSSAGGMKEGVVDGETGFVVEEGDIQAFVDALYQLAANQNRGLEMGNSGREFVLSTFDVQVLGKRLEEIINGLL